MLKTYLQLRYILLYKREWKTFPGLNPALIQLLQPCIDFLKPPREDAFLFQQEGYSII